MLFCAHLTIQVKHRPYLPPLLPQRPRCPQPRSRCPEAQHRARCSQLCPHRHCPPASRPLRARGGRLRGHVCSRRVPAGRRRHLPGAGRAAPSSRRACSGDGGRAVAPPPAAPSRRWQSRSAWGRYPWRSPGRGRVERGAGTGRGLREAPR